MAEYLSNMQMAWGSTPKEGREGLDRGREGGREVPREEGREREGVREKIKEGGKDRPRYSQSLPLIKLICNKELKGIYENCFIFKNKHTIIKL